MRFESEARGAAMAARAFTALVGGYVVAASLAALSARLLPLPRVEATAWAMIFSFLVYAAVGLWAFAESRLSAVVRGVWGTAAIAAAVALALGVRP
jgi:hypothetical protein